jgi:hypothetical protein
MAALLRAFRVEQVRPAAGFRDDHQEIKNLLRESAVDLVSAFEGDQPNKAMTTRDEARFRNHGSLKVTLSGKHWGHIHDFESGEGGYPVQFIMGREKLSYIEAIDWARKWLCLDGDVPAPRLIQNKIDPKAAAKVQTFDTTKYARQIWGAAGCENDGDQSVERYLREHRGITGPLPSEIRGHYGVESKETRQEYPSLLVAAFDEHGDVVRIQVVYLDKETCKKADLHTQKRTYGQKATAYTSRFAARVPSVRVLVCEGPEDAITLWSATGYETRCTMGSGTLDQALFPAGTALTICADNDDAGRKGAEKAARAHTERGCTVRIARPRDGIKDFNKLLQGAGEDAVRACIEAAEPWAPDTDESVAVVAPAVKGSLLDCAAYFPAADLTPDIAGPELRRTITEFLDGAILAAKVRKAYSEKKSAGIEAAKSDASRVAALILESCSQAEGHEAFYRLAMKRAGLRVKADAEITEEMAENAFERIERALFLRGKRDAQTNARTDSLEMFGLSERPKAPRLQLKAAAGLGKTSFVAEELVRRAVEIADLNIHIYVPRNDLANDLAEKIPGAKVMRGRAATTNTGAKEEQYLCVRWQAANKVANANLPVMENMCKRGDGVCPFYDNCLWIAQWRDHAPGVRILNHSYLGLTQPLGMPPADIVIIDESVVKSLVGKVSFSPCRITRRQSRIGKLGASAALVAFADKVSAAIEVTGGELKALRDAGVTAEGLRDAAKFEEEGDDAPKIGPKMEDGDIIRLVDAFERSEAGKVARLYRALADEIDLPRDQSHGVEVGEVKAAIEVDGVKARERQSRVFVHYLHKVRVSRSAGLLLIDADANIQVNRILFGEDLEEADIRVRRNAEVLQVYSAICGKSGIVSGENSSRILQQIRDLIARETMGGRKALVVTYKAVRVMLTGEDPKSVRLPPSGKCGGADVAHFGNIRGNDDFKLYDTVIIVGRYQPPVHVIEGVARALWALDPKPLTFITERNKAGELAWSQQDRGYTMKDGSRAGVEIDCHPDERCQLILELERECETAQAIDRLRLVHCPAPKRVLVLSKLPVDIEVDHLLTWKEMTRGPSRIEVAFDLAGGETLPLIDELLFREMPDLFGSERTAKREIREFTEFLKGPKTLIRYCIAEMALLNLASFGVVGQRRPSKALVRAGLSEDAARVSLAAQMGQPIGAFRIEALAAPDQPAATDTAEIINLPDAWLRLKALSARLDVANPVDRSANAAAALFARLEAVKPPAPAVVEEVEDLSIRLELAQPAKVVTMTDAVPGFEPDRVEEPAPISGNGGCSDAVPVPGGYKSFDWGPADQWTMRWRKDPFRKKKQKRVIDPGATPAPES